MTGPPSSCFLWAVEHIESAPMTFMSPLHTHVPPRKLYRLYEIKFQMANGDMRMIERKLPARPAFEKACAAMARGTLVKTPNGAEAIEDLGPGDIVMSPDGPSKITWIGSTVMIPNLTDAKETTLTQLMRVQTSTLFQGEHGDLVLGPLARVVRTLPDAARPHTYAPKDPFDAFGEGTVIPIIPTGPVRMFQIMLDKGHAVMAQGIAVETLRPDHLEDFATAEDWHLLGQLFAAAPSPFKELHIK